MNQVGLRKIAKRAAVFWTLSISLFAIVGITHYFEEVWQDAGPPFSLDWFIVVVIATVTGAIILWGLSWANPRAWRIIQRMLGAEEGATSSQMIPERRDQERSIYALTFLGGLVIGLLIAVWRNPLLPSAADPFTVAVSASAIATSATAILTYRDSRRGAEIWLLTESSVEPTAWVNDLDNPYRQTLGFRLKLAFLNSGPRGGAVMDIKPNLRQSRMKYETMRDGESSHEYITEDYRFEGPKMGEHFDPDYMALPLEEREPLSIWVTVTLTLRDSDWQKRRPQNKITDLLEVQKGVSLSFNYRVSGRAGKILRRSAEIRVLPKLPSRELVF